VTGHAEYVHNLRLPGMLFGKIFRSTVAHGRIRSIDVSAAQAVPGVYRVITADDVRKVIPHPYYGPAFHDQPILAIDKVRHVGEPVAVVLATDPHIADAATQLIVAEYDELPAVFDEVEAMTSTAFVHEELKPAGTFPDLKHLKGKKNTNIALDFQLRRGDVDKAFADAAHVFDHTFRTQQVLHLPLEPFVSVADAGPSSVTIYTASQSPSFVSNRDRTAARLAGKQSARESAPSRRRLRRQALYQARSAGHRPVAHRAPTGEGFVDHGRAVLHASPNTRRRCTSKAASTRTGASPRANVTCGGTAGAYADIGPRVTQKSGFTAPGPYDIENVSIDSYALYTHLPPARRTARLRHSAARMGV